MNTIITCEHGGKSVPAQYRRLFRGRDRLLNSHRGHDKYALSFGILLARRLSARFFCSTVTRLLVDLNRSPHHPKLFSGLSGQLGADDKELILKEHYEPYRREVEAAAAAFVLRGKSVLHISVHSFAPVIKGITKSADIGILYDPSRYREKAICVQWQKSLYEKAPALKVRRNYPYLGKADGLVTWLRKKFAFELYIGIELEINQGIMKLYGKQRHMLCDTLVSGLQSGLIQF